MKKILLFLTVLSLLLVAGATTLHPSRAFAVTCADSTRVADPDLTLSAADQKTALDAECKDHGGTQSAFAAGCTPTKTSFLGFPTWYKYLQGDSYTDPDTQTPTCHPKLASINDVWKIVAAVIELLLRIAALAAIGFVIYGGILYILSQAQPDKTKLALKTIINALIGLTITIIATALVSFIAGSFK